MGVPPRTRTHTHTPFWERMESSKCATEGKKLVAHMPGALGTPRGIPYHEEFDFKKAKQMDGVFFFIPAAFYASLDRHA